MSLSKNSWLNWGIFIALSFIWGSSFILMKKGLYDGNNTVLTAWQVAALRLLSAGIVLIPFVVKSARSIPFSKWKFVILSGLLGSFFPAFLFCIAETKIDSALAGTLNSLTPIFVIIIGLVLYNTRVSRQKAMGVLLAAVGCFFLLFTQAPAINGNNWYAVFVLVAALCYAMNINMVRQRLQDTGSLAIATVALVSLTVPSLVVLYSTHYFSLPLKQPRYLVATTASVVLGIGGTAIASVIFYVLVKRAGAVFSSMVTYGIPFVAIFWGIIDGESITLLQVLSLAVILAGVFFATK